MRLKKILILVAIYPCLIAPQQRNDITCFVVPSFPIQPEYGFYTEQNGVKSAIIFYNGLDAQASMFVNGRLEIFTPFYDEDRSVLKYKSLNHVRQYYLKLDIWPHAFTVGKERWLGVMYLTDSAKMHIKARVYGTL